METVCYSSISTISHDTSKWVEGTMSTTGSPWIEVPVLLFYTGTHKGETYTKADLKKMEAQFIAPTGELDWETPGQLDHSESASDTVAHLRKVWAAGDQLWGIARVVGAEAVRNVKNGLWRKVSLSVYKSSRKIREFSFTPFPHLAGTTAFSQAPQPSFAELAMQGHRRAFQATTRRLEAAQARAARKVAEVRPGMRPIDLAARYYRNYQGKDGAA